MLPVIGKVLSEAVVIGWDRVKSYGRAVPNCLRPLVFQVDC